jgi:rod shape-determining protein MreC
MERPLNRYTLTTAALVVVAALLIALDLAGRLELRARLYRTTAPVANLAAAWHDLRAGEREHAALAARLAERTFVLGRAEEYKRENDALRAALGFSLDLPYELTYARVVDRKPERWLKAVTVNAGARDGVAVGMPVVGTAGLVGRVSRVTATAAEVELVTSERLRIGAAHAPSGELAAYAADAGGRGHLSYLPRTTELAVGDMVVTAPASRLFPPGLIIGYVRAFRRPYDSMFVEAEVTPAEDVNRLDGVFIVNWRPAGGPATLTPAGVGPPAPEPAPTAGTAARPARR